NLLYYTAFENVMAHSYGFALIAIFVWLTIQWHQRPTWQKTLFLGLVVGLIALIRPTNILVLLFFALYRPGGQASLTAQVKFFLQQWQLILLMIAAFWVVWLPQLMYWKMLTG